MVNAIKALPRWTEFCLIVTICFGMFICTSLVSLVSPPLSFVHDNAAGLAIVGFELVAAALALAVLRWRGWRLPSLCAMHLTWRSTALGVVVIAITYYGYNLLTNITLAQTGARSLPGPYYANVMSLGILLLVSIINPLFEEVFVSGYIMTALRGRGVIVALAASVLIRTSYHLYRGVPGILLIAPLGLVFGVIYWRSRNLWPLVVAHGLLDFVPTGLAGLAILLPG